MGFKEDKSPPFNTHSELTFRKGNTYISPDNTGHRGGFWKTLTRRGSRIGTWNKNLTHQVGK
jgi:hypothetical protein